jgi:hypothetical protein
MSTRLAFVTCALAATVATIALLYNFGYVSLSERPGFTHIWGHVSYNGKAVPGCAIYFQPEDHSSSHWGVGRLNESGLYFLTAFQLDTTLQPGRYTIFIRPLASNLLASEVVRTSLVGDDAKHSTEKSSPPAPPASQLPLPRRFTDVKTSGLVVNITGEPQRIEIHLTD